MSPDDNKVVSIDRYRPDWDTAGNLALIQRTIAPDLTPDEFALFIETARFRGLNPMARQIFALIHNKNNPEKRRLTIITGIDGFRAIANRTGKYAGIDRPSFEGQGRNPEVCILTGYKMVEGQRCAFTVEAYWDEYAVTGYGGEMWAKMPRTMLAKVAEAKLLRMMLPEELSGLYTTDEMHQADKTVALIMEHGTELTPAQLATPVGPASQVYPSESAPEGSTGQSEQRTEPSYASQKNSEATLAAKRWFHANLKDMGLTHEDAAKLLGIHSFGKDLADTTLGATLDMLAKKLGKE